MLFVEVAGLILSHHLWTVSVSISAIFLEVMEESIFGSFVGFNSKVFSSDLVVFFFSCVVSTLGFTPFIFLILVKLLIYGMKKLLSIMWQ